MQVLYRDLSNVFKNFADTLTKTESEIKLLNNVFKRRKIKKVLDVACGVGRHSVPLAKLGYKVVGIDFSSSQLKEAKKYAVKEGVTPTFYLKDANQFNFPNKFDAAICMWTTIGEEPMMYKSVIKNVFNSLKKGGIFIIDNNDWKNIPATKEQFIENKFILNGLSAKQSIHDRFTEHFRIRDVVYLVGKKRYKDICVTHVKKPSEWAEELRVGRFSNIKIIPSYRINEGGHKKGNVFIIGIK